MAIPWFRKGGVAFVFELLDECGGGIVEQFMACIGDDYGYVRVHIKLVLILIMEVNRYHHFLIYLTFYFLSFFYLRFASLALSSSWGYSYLGVM